MNDVLAKAAEYQETYGIVGRAHYLAGDHSRALNRWLGIPVVVITAVVGTTIFGTLNANPDPSWKIVAGLVSLAGTILSSLQTAFGFAQAAEKHKVAGEAYRALRRRFEMFCLKYGEASVAERQAAVAELSEIVSSLSDLPKEFPTIPDRFYDRAKKEVTTPH